MTKTRQRQRKKKRLAERQAGIDRAAVGTRLDPGLPALTPPQEEYETAFEAILNARLLSKFGPKDEYAVEEIQEAWDELKAEGAFPPRAPVNDADDIVRLLLEEDSPSRAR